MSQPSDEHLASLIHLAANRLRMEIARRAFRNGLAPSRSRTPAFLARRPGVDLIALAKALEVQPMSVLRVVDDLEAQGMSEGARTGLARGLKELVVGMDGFGGVT